MLCGGSATYRVRVEILDSIRFIHHRVMLRSMIEPYLWSVQVWLVRGLWALGSIVLAEIVRDLYHLAGHYWQPLQSAHTSHHKAYRRDLSIVSMETYRKAQWHNDVPEAMVMVSVTGIVALMMQQPGLWLGCIYAAGFLITAWARSRGWLLWTDFSHEPGDLVEPPSRWYVNRTYHWRHHFDQGNAYFCGTLTLVDKLLGTSLSLKGKRVAVTGASGTMGRSLLAALSAKGAKVIALTSSSQVEFAPTVQVVTWQVGQEANLQDLLQTVDILVVNHGVNVHGDRTPEAVQQSLEVNALSVWRWMELFLNTVKTSEHFATKELWINTSEAEVSPALSPLYEVSKRLIGELITLRRLDAPCVIRKLILGPFRSNLNPYGVMSARFVAWAIVALAQRDFRNIIVTVNPLTYLLFPIAEVSRSLYFRLFSKAISEKKCA